MIARPSFSHLWDRIAEWIKDLDWLLFDQKIFSSFTDLRLTTINSMVRWPVQVCPCFQMLYFSSTCPKICSDFRFTHQWMERPEAKVWLHSKFRQVFQCLTQRILVTIEPMKAGKKEKELEFGPNMERFLPVTLNWNAKSSMESIFGFIILRFDYHWTSLVPMISEKL